MNVRVLLVAWLVAVIVLGGAVVLLWRWPRTRLARISRHRAAPARRRWRGPVPRLRRFATKRPRLTIVLTGSAAVGAGWLLGGPVAATVGGLYAMVAMRGWQRREARRAVERAYLGVLAAVDAVASDLRAGLVPDLVPIGRAAGVEGGGRDAIDAAVSGALVRLEAAYRISEALGTSMAAVFDRVDADLRSQQRLRQKMRAQAAGAQATSVVLTGLPVVGLALGAGIGADPVHQLLHTPVGAGSAVMAALLQCGGLAWSARLVRSATAGAS